MVGMARKSLSDDSPTTRLNFTIPEDLRDRFQRACAGMGVGVSERLRVLIERDVAMEREAAE